MIEDGELHGKIQRLWGSGLFQPRTREKEHRLRLET